MPAKPKKVAAESKQTYHRNVRLLVAFRCDDPTAPIQDGFARAIGLSDTGALLELPDLYQVGNEFQLEFLLNDNEIAPVKGTITHIDKRKDFYEVAVEFSKPTTKVKHLIRKQTDG